MRIHASAVRALFVALPLPLLLALPLTGQCQTEGDCDATLSAALRSGGSLTIDSVSLGMEIIRADNAGMAAPQTVRVGCSSRHAETARHVSMKLSGDAGNLRLKVSGDTMHDGNLQLRIEVPERTNLRVRMAAGQITIDDVEGDKDCALTAGQITISDQREWNYRSVDASVDIGEVNASAYGREMGGFFRHFETSSGGGEYALHAHVGTGQIDLVGTARKQGQSGGSSD